MKAVHRAVAMHLAAGFDHAAVSRKVGMSKSNVDHLAVRDDVRELVAELEERGPTPEETLRALMLSPNETVRLRASKDLETVLASQEKRSVDGAGTHVAIIHVHDDFSVVTTCPQCGHDLYPAADETTAGPTPETGRTNSAHLMRVPAS